MKPDYTNAKTEYDVFVGWYSSPNYYRFCLGRTVYHPWAATWGTGTGYSAGAFSTKGTWYGNLTHISELRQSVTASIHSKLKFANVTLTIARDNSDIISTLLEDIESTEGFTNGELYVPIFVSRRGFEIDVGGALDTGDMVWLGTFEPYGIEITQSEIKIKLIDPARDKVEKNILDTYQTSDFSDLEKNWADREMPRIYGEWGDLGAGSHFQYGFEVPFINADAMANEGRPPSAKPIWPIFKVGAFGDGANDGDFYMNQMSGIPDMADAGTKVWVFWDGPVAYDILQVRQCSDQTTYPLQEGFLEGVKSIREDSDEWTDEWEDIVNFKDNGAGNPVLVTVGAIAEFNNGDWVLVQEVPSGGSFEDLNGEWYLVQNKNIPNSQFELAGTDCSDFTFVPDPYIPGGGIVSVYYPMYKPYEDIGSRDTENLLARFWIQDSASNYAFYRTSVYEGSGPMENPVEIIYDLLINCAGVTSADFNSTWWATYTTLDSEGIKARRHINKQMTVREAIDEICHDFGLMVFVHAGEWFCLQNRVWPFTTASIDGSLSPGDYKKDSYRVIYDPGKEAIRYDWGVRIYYLFDQDGQVFSKEELQTAVYEQFSKSQDPNQSSDNAQYPHLNDKKYYGTYIFPSVAYWDKCKEVEAKWIHDTTTAQTMCTAMTRALNGNIASSVGNRGFEATVVKRTVDTGYSLGSIFRIYDSTYPDREIVAYGMIYEREIDFMKLEVKEHCYEARVTGE